MNLKQFKREMFYKKIKRSVYSFYWAVELLAGVAFMGLFLVFMIALWAVFGV